MSSYIHYISLTYIYKKVYVYKSVSIAGNVCSINILPAVVVVVVNQFTLLNVIYIMIFRQNVSRKKYPCYIYIYIHIYTIYICAEYLYIYMSVSARARSACLCVCLWKERKYLEKHFKCFHFLVKYICVTRDVMLAVYIYLYWAFTKKKKGW